ncbi:MAG: alpha/beta hydrolase [Pirellulales bacterium]
MADDTLALMDHLGCTAVHLVGHSLGGLIAQCVAIKAPERIRSLSLLCTFSRGSDATKLSWPMFWTGLRTFVGTRQMRRRAFCEIVLPPQLWVERDQWLDRLAIIFGHDLADQPPVVMKQLAAMKAYDATEQLPEIAHVPTLVVGAKFDRISTPDVAQRLANSFPGCRYERFDQAAHGVTVQFTNEINELLLSHFASAEPNN